ncbi:hypothetical protein [Haloarcula onubensis]|uniref:Tat pathway signal protein n=1 Tax=Haloarcula onubensis TaxID=2950539 RepID=A0ABU2FP08_9EURY|nr:hypothetical protein [Halomicroarcula sp. S3CR25-11]MDS0282493.1 hypothetical protein [Halomicroarcula sp. S3CR25-11]
MSGSELTRRALLRRSGVAVAAGVASAGCSTLSGSGGDTDVYTRWLPAPSARNVSHYWFDYYDLSALAAQRESLGGEPTVFERTWAPVGLDWDDATAVVAVDGVDVVTAEFDRDGAAADLREADYERAGEYKGYVRYRDADTGRVFAVTDGTLLVSSAERYAPASVAPSERLETVVDAVTGDIERYAEVDEDMRALVEELGTATIVSGTTRGGPDAATTGSGRFENLVARGTSSAVDGDTVEETWVYLYDRPEDVDLAALEAYVEANDDPADGADAPFATVEDISYAREGRTGIVTGTRDAEAYYA